MIEASDAGRTGLVWSSFPPNQPLAKDEIHVWLAGLEDADICVEYCADCLSSAERDRAAHFKFAPDRKRYLIAHGALRSILGMYLSVRPSAIELGSGPAGKPKLARSFASDELEFNLSHSGEVALIAVMRGTEVGIDIEHIQKGFAFQSIAQRFFTSSEVAALQNLPPHLQRETFYKCWTSKEALVKAKGTGLSGPLDEVQIALTATGVRITPVGRGWSLSEVGPIGGYAAALAVAMPERKVECYRWKASMLPKPVHVVPA